jgi:hypothetical protein
MADTSASALDQAGALAERILNVALDQGVERSNVQTVNISLRDWFDAGKQNMIGRVATYSLKVNLNGVDQVGPLLAEVTPIAANSLQVGGIHLSIGDPQPLLVQARRAAVQDALSTARELAAAAGVQLGKITTIEDGGEFGSTPRRHLSGAVAAASASIGVEAGTSEIAIRVRITFEIED